MDITTLKHHRGVVKGSFTKTLNYLNALDKAAASVSVLKNRRLLTEQHFQRFEELQQQIEELTADDDAEFTLQIKERDEAEAKFLEIVSKIDDLLQELRTVTVPSSTHTSCSHSRGSVKLPPIDLPTFTGKYEDWTSFMDLFEATIHHNATLSDVQKLQYLKSAVKEEAAAVIRNLQVTSSNYVEAWTLLKSRYDNHREIVYAQMKRLFAIPNVKSATSQCIQQVLDQTNECVRALTVLKEPTDQWDTFLVYLTLDKLDNATKRQWALKLTASDLPSYNELSSFLEQHIRGLNASNISTQPQPSTSRGNERRTAATHHISNSSNTPNCVMCKTAHPLFKCTKFLAQSSTERMETVKKYSLCFNCLRPNHRTVDCRSTHKCKTCNRQHNSLLHFNKPQATTTENPPPTTAMNVSRMQQSATDVLLSTAMAKVKDSSGDYQQCRIMLDTGSQATFITEACANALGLKRQWDRTLVTGAGSKEVGYTRGKVKLNLCSNIYNENIDIEALVMSHITSEVPHFRCEKDWNHLAGIQLADPNYFQPGEIDILLGSEYITTVMSDGKLEGERLSPAAYNTIFGWVLAGRVTVQVSNTVRIHHTQCHTDTILQRFWEVEEIPPRQHMTDEERICEEHFLQTYQRDATGRFCVQLPVKSNIKKLGMSRDIAICRLKQVERRLTRQPEFRVEYNEFMREYIQLGHMQRVPRGELTERPGGETYYLPHHFVVKPDSTSTRFRVVYDGSAVTTTGISLNNCLRVGATIQDDIFTLLLRFRLHKVALKADIAKMFRQFRISEKHIDLQRIVWREDPAHPIEDYQLLTVTYGTSCAPFTATRCLQQLGEENKSKFPTAATKLCDDLYVDDLMSGENSTEEAISVVRDLNQIAETAGLSFRKWSSNDPTVLQTIPEGFRETTLPFSFDKGSSIKALGVQWNPPSDNFTFSEIQYKSATKITKRVILSQLAKVFDPLGFLSPVTVRAKLFMQKLWKSEMSWDDVLSEEMSKQWHLYSEGLKEIKKITIPRWIKTDTTVNLQLHGFSDAAEGAFGAVIYGRCELADGTYECNMIAAKSKVAPLKQITIARLELCGAVLLTQLFSSVIASLKFTGEIWAWTDSTIVLDWLSAHPRKWVTFVANRVSMIQELIPRKQWHHVKSEDNPADLISRGISVHELCNSGFYWKGPGWLSSASFPTHEAVPNSELVHTEERKIKTFVAHIILDASVIDKFSSLTTLNRVVSYVYRFINNCKVNSEKSKGSLNALELRTSLSNLIMIVQNTSFATEINNLKRNKCVGTSSKLTSLNPFVDHAGVLRVGGRLTKANLSMNEKHQIILPYDAHFTKLLILQTHLKLLHGGLRLTWSHLQRYYWIVNGRNTIRHLLRKCVVCRRNRAETMQQLMGALPTARVNPNPAFTHSGVDYAGPFNLRVMKGRSNRTFKGYFAIFVCMGTKAVHLEAAGDLTTESFLAALRRFVSRRGAPSVVYSDCGTNFVGANKELQELLKKESHNQIIQDDLAQRGIEWRFNIPASPNRGGIWEAGVKSVKYHLRRVVGNQTLTFEEFATILSQVEACLNSRPLCALSSDPADLDVLTPGHFLIGRPLTAIPQSDVTSIKINRLSRWQYVQQVTQHFWKRWSVEYLSSLQQRFKWKVKRDNLCVGDLVLIRDEILPPLKWKLGRVVEVHEGADNCVRSVTVKTANGLFKRTIVKLTPILFHNE